MVSMLYEPSAPNTQGMSWCWSSHPLAPRPPGADGVQDRWSNITRMSLDCSRHLCAPRRHKCRCCTSQVSKQNKAWADAGPIIPAYKGLASADGLRDRCPRSTRLPYTWLAHHRLQTCLGAPRCPDQPRHMPGDAVVYSLAHPQHQLSHRKSRCLDFVRRTAPGYAWLSYGRLAHTWSAPVGPRCKRLAVWKKCPHFRHSMLREPVSHTISSNCAMVCADALTSLRTCLALLQAAVLHTIGSCIGHGASRSLDQPRDMPGAGWSSSSDTISTMNWNSW